MPYLETAVEIAREAGALLANYFERRVAFELKGDFDLVTEADRASEQLIVERLRSHFPTHGIMAEEGGGLARCAPHRFGGPRPGLRGVRAAGCFLGIRFEAVGYGGRRPVGARSRGRGF